MIKQQNLVMAVRFHNGHKMDLITIQAEKQQRSIHSFSFYTIPPTDMKSDTQELQPEIDHVKVWIRLICVSHICFFPKLANWQTRLCSKASIVFSGPLYLTARDKGDKPWIQSKNTEM